MQRRVASYGAEQPGLRTVIALTHDRVGREGADLDAVRLVARGGGVDWLAPPREQQALRRGALAVRTSVRDVGREVRVDELHVVRLDRAGVVLKVEVAGDDEQVLVPLVEGEPDREVDVVDRNGHAVRRAEAAAQEDTEQGGWNDPAHRRRGLYNAEGALERSAEV